MSAARNEAIKKEAQRIKDALGAAPTAERRCIAAVAKRILLDGPYFYNGRHCDPQSKGIGVGVYIITLKKEPSNE